jgi:hypothetical protein
MCLRTFLGDTSWLHIRGADPHKENRGGKMRLAILQPQASMPIKGQHHRDKSLPEAVQPGGFR